MGCGPSDERDAKSEALVQRDAKEEKDLEEKTTDEINRLTLYVIQARNLPNYDPFNSKSDPFVKVKFGDFEHDYRTENIRREANPTWNAQFFEEGTGLFGKLNTIRLDVFDHDSLSKDDFMGCCAIKTDTNPSIPYSTAVQWIDLLDDKGAKLKGANGKQAAIQIQLKYVLNADDINIRYYTHIMEFTVKKGKNIPNKEFLGRSDPYVKLEWGAQAYSTKTANNTLSPEWNEKAYLFVHSKFQNKYQLKLRVMDEDIGADTQLGTGYISADQVFKNCGLDGNKPYTLDVDLRAVPVDKDKGLIVFTKDDGFPKWGDLEVEITLTPRDVLEKEFYSELVKTFDKNDDGVIDKQEVATMFSMLKVPEDNDVFFKKFDSDNDMKLDENEVVQMLQDADFQGSELATQLMSIYLGGNLGGDYQKHLMSGFTHKHTDTSKIIKIKHRTTGLVVQEHIPNYVWYSLKLVYNNDLGRSLIQTDLAVDAIYRASKNKGDAMDAPESVEDIPAFVEQHSIDTRQMHKKVDEFKSFNDFFARGIDVEKHRPLSKPEEDNVIVSPADCRMMLWDSILDSTKFWIKGSKFTLESLCGSGAHKVNLKKYHGGSFVIARLAPQDYHRWHYPLDGRVVNVHAIDGALYTVNPIAVNKEIDVFSENKRCIVEIENEKHGSYIMFVIAAAMVGSYKLHKKDHEDPVNNDPIGLQVGDEVKRGAVAGEFRFGGSTILLLFENKIKINFDADVQRNVAAKFETLVTVRERIGRIV